MRSHLYVVANTARLRQGYGVAGDHGTGPIGKTISQTVENCILLLY